MDSKFLQLIFPPKCTLCRNLLKKEETDLCRNCRKDGPEFTKSKRNIPFVAHWTGIWYYKGAVRNSVHRFKFGNARRYAGVYARLLAIKLQREELENFDIISWVPIAWPRKFFRGYDQSKLLAIAFSKEWGQKPVAVLRKIRSTPPQSGIPNAAMRRANVSGAYRALSPEQFRGKRILLLDDVVTTGATSSECARTLLTAGAKEVILATIGVAVHD